MDICGSLCLADYQTQVPGKSTQISGNFLTDQLAATPLIRNESEMRDPVCAPRPGQIELSWSQESVECRKGCVASQVNQGLSAGCRHEVGSG